MSDPPPFQFSILRLGAATTLAAVPFALYAADLFPHLGLTITISAALAGVVMLGQGVMPVANILIGAGLGFVVVALLTPANSSESVRIQLGNDLHNIWEVIGAIIGCVLGMAWNLYDAATEVE